jgi:scyllo-inositol 2-dehydrogenase (NADP+)
MERKMAIIGFGGMGSWHCDNVTKRVDGLTVKGIYDIRPEACSAAREKGLVVYAGAEELLADSETSLVTIAVPNNFHKDYAIRALRAGKNVICEKPVAMNSRELEEILAAAKQAGRVFTVHQNRRLDRDFRIIKRIYDENMLGELYFIESRVQGSGRMLHGWRGHAENGGGMLYDWGVHLFDQLLWMIPSPVVSVTSHLTNVYYDEVDDNLQVFLRFRNGQSALVEVSTNCFVNQPRWYVEGKLGTAVVRNWQCEGEMVTMAGEKGLTWSDDIVYTAAGPTRTMAPRPEETKTKKPLPEVDTDWSMFYKNVCGVLDGRDELMVKPEETLRVMKLIDLIFESKEKGTPLSCEI